MAQALKHCSGEASPPVAGDKHANRIWFPNFVPAEQARRWRPEHAPTPLDILRVHARTLGLECRRQVAALEYRLQPASEAPPEGGTPTGGSNSASTSLTGDETMFVTRIKNVLAVVPG
jgi:hypothetical protein